MALITCREVFSQEHLQKVDRIVRYYFLGILVYERSSFSAESDFIIESFGVAPLSDESGAYSQAAKKKFLASS